MIRRRARTCGRGLQTHEAKLVLASRAHDVLAADCVVLDKFATLGTRSDAWKAWQTMIAGQSWISNRIRLV